MELKNKRVLVVGLGRSGLAAARFLKAQGARVTVSDSRPAATAKELPQLLDEGIMVEAGSHGLLTFRRQDLIVVSPGVPQSVPELKQVRALGMRSVGEMELGAQFLVGEMVATLVGGNIGRPVVEMVAEATPASWSVLEVSSFQLETIESFRPHIALVLNITPDHLDRHGSFEHYAAAKARITENQGPDDFLVLNAEDKPTQMVGAKTKAQIFWFSPSCGAPAGVCARAGRGALFQRLQGDECGCHAEGAGGVSGGHSRDPGRQGQGLGLRCAGAAARGAGENGYHDWFRRGKDRNAAG